jgi:hypothetical protein
MQRQIEMENNMLQAHREFVTNLNKSVDMLDEDIKEAAGMTEICTGEWCFAIEDVIDELHKCIYSISEPRWLTEDDSKALRDLRRRVRDIYVKYKGIQA